MHKLAIVTFAALSFTSAHAAPPSATIEDAWVRVLPGDLPAAGYFTLHNAGTKPLVLTDIESADCGMTMLHKSSQGGGMARMEDVSSVTVPAGGQVAFAPGGYHLMCMEPSAKLKPGTTTTFTLHFSGGASLTATFAVRGATGK